MKFSNWAFFVVLFFFAKPVKSMFGVDIEVIGYPSAVFQSDFWSTLCRIYFGDSHLKNLAASGFDFNKEKHPISNHTPLGHLITSYRNTPIFDKSSTVQKITLLFNNGANPNLCSKRKTPFYWAASQGNFFLLPPLRKAGARFDGISLKEDQLKALMNYLANEDSNGVVWALNGGVKPNMMVQSCVDEVTFEETLFSKAVKAAQLDLAFYALQKGADINAKDSKGSTCFLSFMKFFVKNYDLSASSEVTVDDDTCRQAYFLVNNGADVENDFALLDSQIDSSLKKKYNCAKKWIKSKKFAPKPNHFIGNYNNKVFYNTLSFDGINVELGTPEEKYLNRYIQNSSSINRVALISDREIALSLQMRKIKKRKIKKLRASQNKRKREGSDFLSDTNQLFFKRLSKNSEPSDSSCFTFP